VEDTTPPLLDVALSPQMLWPPNHKLVPVEAAIRVSDGCDPSPAVRLVSVTSSEPDNATGDGNTTGDIQGADFGQDDRSFSLRAERRGSGKGRTYAVTFEAEDASGNRTTRTVVVNAPHQAAR
jgi:endo-1,4-beta-xylanase